MAVPTGPDNSELLRSLTTQLDEFQPQEAPAVDPQFGAGGRGFLGALAATAQGPEAVARFGARVASSAASRTQQKQFAAGVERQTRVERSDLTTRIAAERTRIDNELANRRDRREQQVESTRRAKVGEEQAQQRIDLDQDREDRIANKQEFDKSYREIAAVMTPIVDIADIGIEYARNPENTALRLQVEAQFPEFKNAPDITDAESAQEWIDWFFQRAERKVAPSLPNNKAMQDALDEWKLVTNSTLLSEYQQQAEDEFRKVDIEDPNASPIALAAMGMPGMSELRNSDNPADETIHNDLVGQSVSAFRQMGRVAKSIGGVAPADTTPGAREITEALVSGEWVSEVSADANNLVADMYSIDGAQMRVGMTNKEQGEETLKALAREYSEGIPTVTDDPEFRGSSRNSPFNVALRSLEDQWRYKDGAWQFRASGGAALDRKKTLEIKTPQSRTSFQIGKDPIGRPAHIPLDDDGATLAPMIQATSQMHSDIAGLEAVIGAPTVVTPEDLVEEPEEDPQAVVDSQF